MRPRLPDTLCDQTLARPYLDYALHYVFGLLPDEPHSAPLMPYVLIFTFTSLCSSPMLIPLCSCEQQTPTKRASTHLSSTVAAKSKDAVFHLPTIDTHCLDFPIKQTNNPTQLSRLLQRCTCTDSWNSLALFIAYAREVFHPLYFDHHVISTASFQHFMFIAAVLSINRR